jgi:hypothetical protein
MSRRAFPVDWRAAASATKTHAALVLEIAQYARYLRWTVIVTPRGGIAGEPGVSDLVMLRAGRAVFVEVKVGRDKLGPDQIAFKEQVERQGFGFVEARSLEDVVKATS